MRLGEVVRIVVLFLALVKRAISDNIVRITNESEFKDFVNKVNSGTSYSATTVYLSSDLSFSGNTLEPIGNNDKNYFRGVFDDQGYIINNIKMNVSNALYAGLFGHSEGLTIRNVVLDDSCSITNSYISNYNAFVGGIVGYCNVTDSKCNIENSVNMASVVFSGNANYELYLGGIAGCLGIYSYSSSGYDSYMKNCVNYGFVTHSGTSNKSYIGGVVGLSYGGYYSSYYYAYLKNCLNYGTVTHSGTTSNSLDLGGITGYTYIAELHNCLSIGAISMPNPPSSGHKGAIVGLVDSDTSLYDCFFTENVGISSYYGYINYYPSLDHTPDSSTTISDAVSNLNNYYSSSKGWSKWLLNPNSATVTLKISKGKDFSFSSKIILVPEPVKEGNKFLFWCKDAECNEVFDPETESVSGSTDLYAAWVNNTVTFDFDNGTTVNVTFTYNEPIIYPEEEGYTLSWANYHELMPAKDITVTAVWTPNNYTVTFDFDNGTTVNETFTYNTEIVYPDEEGYTLSWGNYHELMPAKDITVTAQWIPNNYTVAFDANGGNVSETSKIVTFDEKYGDLPEPRKEGYMFIGWFTMKNEKVTNETTVTTPYNHTLYARWEEVTNYVEIIFSKKDLTKKEVEKIIKQYAKAEFKITKFEEGSESGEISVIIKFADKEDAKEFVGEINKSGGGDVIKEVKFVFGGDDSFSLLTYPLSFLNALFL